MDNYKITKNDVGEALSNPTKVRGMVLKSGYWKLLKEKLGDKQMRLIEKEAKNLGFSLKLEKIRDLDWYPAGIIIMVFYVLQEKFNFKEKDFAELAENSPKQSFIIKMLMRYFISPEKIVKIAASSSLWRRHFDRGKVEIAKFQESKDKKSGFLVLRVKDFKLHPFYLFYIGHYFLGMFKLARKFKEVTVKETKSPFRGDEYQEYLFQWVF